MSTVDIVTWAALTKTQTCYNSVDICMPLNRQLFQAVTAANCFHITRVISSTVMQMCISGSNYVHAFFLFVNMI